MRPEAEVTGIYSRAGFGGSARRGTQPALIVVDLQRGFTEPAFSTGADMSGAVEATNLLLDAFHRLKAPVILTQIAFAPAEISSSMFPWLDKATGMRTLLEGAEPTALDHRLRTVPTDVIVAKKAASAFFGTGLAHMLAGRQVDTAVIVGATTSGCVRASVVDSVSSGYPTLVVREAVADRAIPPHDAALFDIREKYGDVIDLAETLDYLNTLNAT
ncbi:MAG: isochorismatase family protein [Actinomycetota bacterium]|nr:isochorismatase family protein [Actinomycetota bacterium]